MSTSAQPIVRVGPAGDQDNRDVANDTPDMATAGTRGGPVVRALALPLVGLTLGALPGAGVLTLHDRAGQVAAPQQIPGSLLEFLAPLQGQLRAPAV